MDKLHRIQEELSSMEDEILHLLSLEETLTLQKVYPERFSEEDKDDARHEYRAASMRLLGYIRRSRTEV